MVNDRVKVSLYDGCNDMLTRRAFPGAKYHFRRMGLAGRRFRLRCDGRSALSSVRGKRRCISASPCNRRHTFAALVEKKWVGARGSSCWSGSDWGRVRFRPPSCGARRLLYEEPPRASCRNHDAAIADSTVAYFRFVADPSLYLQASSDMCVALKPRCDGYLNGSMYSPPRTRQG